MAKLSIIYYSTYGHAYKMAKVIAEAAEAKGADVRVRKVKELIPNDVIEGNDGMKTGADLQRDVPEATNDDLVWADAVVFGSGTRYGNMTAQLKNFLDQTGPLWNEGKLIGKLAGFYTGTSTIHGGQESTILTMSTFAYHMGMLIVPVGYGLEAVSKTEGGGSPYGASYLASEGEFSDDETAVARYLGEMIVGYADKLAS
ncbi:NAD(P)H:quinone oxidoreductase [soil metagenome]